MGRRKKESADTHRGNIAKAAERLFAAHGIEASTMDDIAKEAGYSKATLYVYYAKKEEIVGYLVLSSMKLLHEYIAEAIAGPGTARERYVRICKAMERYQEQYPLYFALVLREINIDFEKGDYLAVDRETYEVGEQINREIERFLRQGIASGDLRLEMPILPTVFLFWSTVTGLIQMAANKEEYMKKFMGLSKQEFLELGYEQLFRLIDAHQES